MTKAKKQRIKEIALKTLHAVCYVLSAICLITYIIVAVNSCSARKHDQQIDNASSQLVQQQRLQPNKLYNDGIDNYYCYVNKYYGNNVSINFQDLVAYYDLTTGLFDSELPTRWYGGAVPNGSYLINYEGVVEYISYYQVSIASYEADNGDYFYSLGRMLFTTTIGSNYDAVIYTEHNEGEGFYNRYNCSSFKIILANAQIIDYPFLRVFEIAQTSSFTFNVSFNFNAPALQPSGNAFWYVNGLDNVDINTTIYESHYIGWFYSNNQLFDTIKWGYRHSKGIKFIKDGSSYSNNSAIDGMEGYGYYYEMVYYNSLTGFSEVVNYRNRYWRESEWGLPEYYYTDATTWYNDGYRYIYILEPLSETNTIFLQSFNNNSNNSITGNVATSTGGDIGNVFTLVGSAFTSLIPILSITILPGITLGILIFVPLVAMLVFAIIRIIKK